MTVLTPDLSAVVLAEAGALESCCTYTRFLGGCACSVYVYESEEMACLCRASSLFSSARLTTPAAGDILKNLLQSSKLGPMPGTNVIRD